MRIFALYFGVILGSFLGPDTPSPYVTTRVGRLKTIRKKRILKPCLMQESDISAKVRQSRFSDPFSLQSKRLQPDYVSSYSFSISPLILAEVVEFIVLVDHLFDIDGRALCRAFC